MNNVIAQTVPTNFGRRAAADAAAAAVVVVGGGAGAHVDAANRKQCFSADGRDVTSRPRHVTRHWRNRFRSARQVRREKSALGRPEIYTGDCLCGILPSLDLRVRRRDDLRCKGNAVARRIEA